MLWRYYETGPMIAAAKAGWRYQVPIAVLLVCFTLGTAACSTTNNNGNCNAQGGSNGVTCIVPASTAAGSHPPPGSPSSKAVGSVTGWSVLWSGPVGITGNGLNFDDQPRPSPQSADIYYNGSLYSASSAILAVWQQTQAPTAGQCQAWVTTHPSSSVSNLTAGMQICLQTGQGRPVLLDVQSVTGEELDADAKIWQQQ